MTVLTNLLQRKNVETWLVFVVTAVFLLSFADYDGFEGDDINSVVPMFHLAEAIDGQLLIYRYAWQPLSYWTGAAVFAISGSVSAIFGLAGVGVALAIAMLYRTVRFHIGLAPLLFVPLLLLFPEIIYTGLYFNSSALAFPWVVLAVLLIFEARTARGAAVTGCALAIAVLMRFDFVLVGPAVVLLRVWYVRSSVDFAVLVVAGLATLAISYGIGLFQPTALIDIYQTSRAEIIALADTPGWDDRTKLFVLTVVFSPVGWIAMGLAGFWVLRHRAFWFPAAVGLICFVPMFFAARNMLTAKYLMPLFALLPVLIALAWVHFRSRASNRSYVVFRNLWCIAAVVSLIVSIEPRPQSPYFKITTSDPFQIGTHDGTRSWGAYLLQMSRVNDADFLPAQPANDLMNTLLDPSYDHDIVLTGGQNVFDNGGLGWRHLQLRLERAGFHGQLTARNQISFALPNGSLVLAQADSIPDGDACVVPLETDAEAASDPVGWISKNC